MVGYILVPFVNVQPIFYTHTYVFVDMPRPFLKGYMSDSVNRYNLLLFLWSGHKIMSESWKVVFIFHFYALLYCDSFYASSVLVVLYTLKEPNKIKCFQFS